jgi:hypothetical protein
VSAEEFTTLEELIEALDQETACRVARLVVGCGASISLALEAVQVATPDASEPQIGISRELAVGRQERN